MGKKTKTYKFSHDLPKSVSKSSVIVIERSEFMRGWAYGFIEGLGGKVLSVEEVETDHTFESEVVNDEHKTEL